MTLLSNLRDVDLEKQVELLGKEIASLKRLVASRSSAFYRDWSDSTSDNYADLSKVISSILPGLLGRTTRRGVIGNHPAAVAMVGLLVVGFAASVFLKRWPAAPRVTERPGRNSVAARATSPRRTASARAASSGTASSKTASSRKSTGRSKRVGKLTDNVDTPKVNQQSEPGE